MTNNFYQISDLEDKKLNEILELFSHDCVLADYNDDFIYIRDGKKIYRLDRSKVSPNIEAKEAVNDAFKHLQTNKNKTIYKDAMAEEFKDISRKFCSEIKKELEDALEKIEKLEKTEPHTD